jgi:hypothetical protein
VSNTIFSIQAHTGPNTLVHGRALATGTYDASASFHRGIDLSLGIDVSAQVSADIRDAATASLSAGVGVRAGLALQAAFPLDLFTEAGLVARFRAQAAAAAYLNARIGLPIDVFRGMVREQLPPGWAPFADIFLSELLVEAGFWARASFAAEVLAEATVTGTLLGEHPGFTCSAQWAAGLGFGAGMQFVTNFGFRDAGRLVERLAQQFAAVVESELSARLADAPPAVADAVRGALPLLRLLVPLGARTGLALGTLLVQAPAGEARDRAAAALVDSVARQAQDLLLRALLEFAVERVTSALGGSAVAAPLLELLPDDRDDVIDALLAVDDALAQMEALEHADVQEWIAAILRLVDPVGAVLQRVGLSARDRAPIEEGLALAWAVTAILQRVGRWSSPTAPASGSLLDTVVEGLGSVALVAAAVSRRLGTAPGTPLTLRHAVRFVFAVVDLSQLARAQPALRPAVEWLQQLLDPAADDGPFEILLWELLEQGRLRTEVIVPRLAPLFERAVTQQLETHVFANVDRLAPAAAPLVREVLRPTVASLAGVTLPGLVALAEGRPRAAERLREQLSCVLLLCVGRFVLTSTEALLAEGLRQGASSLTAAADEITDASNPLVQVLGTVSGASLGVLPGPEDAAGILRLAAGTVRKWNDEQRDALFTLLESLITLGLADPTKRDLTADWQTLGTTDAPLERQRLDAVLGRLLDGGWNLLAYVVPEAIRLFVEHWARVARNVLQVVATGAQAVVAATEQAISWLAQQAGALAQLVSELAHQALSLAAEAAGWIQGIADRLAAQVGEAVDTIRELGWSLFEPIIPDGDFELWVRTTLYDPLFDFLKWLLTLPLQVLSQIARLIKEALERLVSGGAVRKDTLVQSVRGGVATWAAQDMRLRLAIDGPGDWDVEIATIVIPSGQILQSLATFVFGDAEVDGRLNEVVRISDQRARVEAQQRTAQAALAQNLDQQRARAEFDAMFTGQPLTIRIEGPLEGSTYTDRARLRVVVLGANRTFLEQRLGSPPRIRVHVNGAEQSPPSAWWTDVPNGVALELDLVLPWVAPAGGPQWLVRPGINSVLVLGTDGRTAQAQAMRAFHIRPSAPPAPPAQNAIRFWAAGAPIRLLRPLAAGSAVDVEYGGQYLAWQGAVVERFVHTRMNSGPIRRTPLLAAQVTAEGGGTQITVYRGRIDVPEAGSLELWFSGTTATGRTVYDSRYGQNYHFNVGVRPTLTFRRGWTHALDGALRGGETLVVDYDPSRLPRRRYTYGGIQPAWSVTMEWRFDGGPVQSAPLTQDAGSQIVPALARIPIPDGRRLLECWFRNTDPTGTDWDSRYRQNYRFAIE